MKLRDLSLALALFAVSAFFAIESPQFLSARNLSLLMIDFSITATLAIGMLLMFGFMLALLYVLPPPWILPLSITVFVLAWIGQFIGHKIEGKKPSFFDDLRFLLIGPLFVLGVLYRRLHISY